ncbi:MAG: hypothetical protein ACJ8FY_27150 [Gemmataceae bacterium]
MELESDVWFEDRIAPAVKALGKQGQADSSVIRAVEEALRRAMRLRDLEAILAAR